MKQFLNELKNYKKAVLAFFALVLVFIFVHLYIKSNTNFHVVHFQEVEQKVDEDGKYTAGSPEVYHVEISPSLCWELSKNGTGAWRFFAWLLIAVAAIYISLAASNKIHGNNLHVFVILALSLGCYIGAYSSAFSNNYVEVSKEKYEQIKDNKSELKQLFLDRDLIK